MAGKPPGKKALHLVMRNVIGEIAADDKVPLSERQYAFRMMMRLYRHGFVPLNHKDTRTVLYAAACDLSIERDEEELEAGIDGLHIDQLHQLGQAAETAR